MDKKVLIPLAVLMLSACVKDMDYKPGSVGPQLIMNSLMSAGKGPKAVYLGVSNNNKLTKLEGTLTVQCLVNGKEVVVTEADAFDWPEYEYDNEGYDNTAEQEKQRVFVIDTPLAPGDKVELSAKSAKFSAGSSVTVPSAPKVNKVDTLSTKDERGEYYTFKVDMNDDVKGADYYCMSISVYVETDYYSEDELIETGEEYHRCTLDCSDDIVLAEDNIASTDGNEMFSVGTPNIYGAFLDKQFDGGQIVLRPKVNKNELNSRLPLVNALGVHIDKVLVRASVTVRVSHIQGRYYHYLKALNNIVSSSQSIDLSLEKVSIPDNITGGIGFFGIDTPVETVITLPERSFSLVPTEP